MPPLKIYPEEISILFSFPEFSLFKITAINITQAN